METHRKSLTELASRILSDLDRSDAELSILITDDAEIRSLNSAYRDLDRSTDVLSFSQQEGEGFPGDHELLGDIVISLDTAVRQAGELGHSVEEEMNRLLIHGVFHLLGYDHERGEEEAVQMRAEEEKYLSRANGLE
jgi:probable rRNA maturation factor